jgi:hypothetical protein
MFFFEKKNQKTLAYLVLGTWISSLPYPAASRMAVRTPVKAKMSIAPYQKGMSRLRDSRP